MAESDGKVRIIIDTNAEAAAKQLNDVGTAFKKNADTIQKSSTVYGGYEKAVRDNIEVLKELALGGNQNTEGFKKLALQTKNYKQALDEANSVVNKAVGGFEKQSSPVSALTSKLKGLVGAYLGLRGIQAVYNFAMQATEAFREQERAVLSLNTTLANAGVYSQQYSKSIQELASQIQSYSNYGDEAIIKAQSLGQAYIGQTKITEQLTKAVVDFAAATGMDLEQAFSLVGKSIGSSTNALGRYGIELNKNMSDSEKMTAIATQLGNRYEGQARQMANASTQLKNAMGDLAEEIGRSFNPIIEKTQKLLAGATNKLTTFLKTARDNKVKEDIKTYQDLIRFETGQLQNATGKERAKLEQSIAKSRAALSSLQKEQTGGTFTNKTPVKIKDEFSSFSMPSTSITRSSRASSGGASSQAKQIKDSYDLATEAVNNARRAVQNAALQYGTSSTQVQTAFEQYRQANQKLADVDAIFKIEQQKGAYQQLQDRVTSLTQTLRDLAAENKINTDEWNINKTALDETKLRLQKVDDTLKQTGINTEQVAKSISSSLSSGIINAVRNGGNAFESFSNIAVSALQKVLDKVLEMSVINPILNSITGSIGGGGIFGTILGGIGKAFGFKNGAAFRNGNVIPFARGGVVNKPTVFPMKNGVGLMGETRPEAIMPLTRKNGKLGVEASNTGAVVNIYNYSGANVETQKRDDGSLDVFIKRVNYALQSEKTSSGFKSAYAREDRKGVQAC